MKETKFPQDWDEERVRRVLEHYEIQSDEEALAEDEAACVYTRSVCHLREATGSGIVGHRHFLRLRY